MTMVESIERQMNDVRKLITRSEEKIRNNPNNEIIKRRNKNKISGLSIKLEEMGYVLHRVKNNQMFTKHGWVQRVIRL